MVALLYAYIDITSKRFVLDSSWFGPTDRLCKPEEVRLGIGSGHMEPKHTQPKPMAHLSLNLAFFSARVRV